ncbi:hypothetical protein SERLADRAFT_475290 [Serpula lacrymans var. lacrymans S7.9]|uniref:Uncharacterized protein n=1 Tax=Serpula lacrymans var. lacrymans (strain S7.9) TaxID=578457 RepID=F8P642_SERL9|nr:uncharacterized protein SERLADRAFT_475290 [Serpula lacrymans var. lacrymans S7.9]EGO20909.1 hypothetical protein SERLADRAFT_475290 [Serpula lacrymans var. lacrymans S7.9]
MQRVPAHVHSHSHILEDMEMPSRPASSPVAVSPPRLLSPITLVEPIYPSCKSKSPPPCVSTPRRRGKKRTVRSSRLRHHSPRLDCPFDSFGAAIFDKWASGLDSPIEAHRRCTANPSQIPMAEDFPDSIIPTGPGPVRRRKTSLRSNPLGTIADLHSSEVHTPRNISSSYHSPDCMSVNPQTPPPHAAFDPSRIAFYNLMPVLPALE